MPEPGDGQAQKSPGERFGELLREWRIVVSRLMDEAEAFTKEKPGVGLMSSFLMGFFLGRFFGRR